MSDAHWWLWFNAIEPIVKSLLRWSFLYVGSWHPSDVAVADNLSSGQGIASGRYALDAQPYDAAARGASRVRAPNRTTSLTGAGLRLLAEVRCRMVSAMVSGTLRW
jgi:hypothetical protein